MTDEHSNEEAIRSADLKAIRRKYLQLGREIEQGRSHADLQHSHSKLGIFIENFVGYMAWKAADK